MLCARALRLIVMLYVFLPDVLQPCTSSAISVIVAENYMRTKRVYDASLITTKMWITCGIMTSPCCSDDVIRVTWSLERVFVSIYRPNRQQVTTLSLRTVGVESKREMWRVGNNENNEEIDKIKLFCHCCLYLEYTSNLT